MNPQERAAVRAAFAKIDGASFRISVHGQDGNEAATLAAFLIEASVRACDALDAADQRNQINAAVIVELHAEVARLEAVLRVPNVSC